MHILRTQWMSAGKSLSAFAAHIAERFAIVARILPMSDAAVRTIVQTTEGDLPFQRYFVGRRCEPVVRAIRFAGAKEAEPPAGLVPLITSPSLQAIVICPSNPYLSVDPILAVPGLAAALAARAAPVIAVSPIIGRQAVKGPTAKIMTELGLAVTTETIAGHYRGLIDGLVIDAADAADGERVGLPVLTTRTMMRDIADRERLARDVMAFADTLKQRPAAKLIGGRR
jgi:LPPG:FO 2-phospho-L-lactate transferase